MLDKDLDKMEKKFKSPPREYSPQVWWFWNGDIQEEKINWQLQEMVDKGVYGAFMHARPGLVTPYLSDRWWEVVGYTIKRAKELGFYAWIYDEYAWPSGTAGSPYKCSPQPFSKVLAEGEKNYAKGLRYLEKRVKGPGRIRINFPQSMGKLECIIAAKSLSLSSIDVTSLSELPHRLNFAWEVPSGDWVIIAFFSYIVEDRVDYLNPQTIAKFIEVTHEEYYKRYAQYFNSTVPGVFFDEIHNDGRPFVWTEGFLEKFEAIKGYDLRKYLPLLIYEGGDITDKIRCDYFDVVTALYEKAWFKQIADWCEGHRIKLTGHTEEWLPEQALSQGDYFRTMRHLQIPGTDNHCFRYRYPRRVDPIESKVISSVAHLAAKERVVAEAMGGAGWAITPQMLKYGADMLYVFGVNMLVPHGFFYTMDSPSAMDDWPQSWFYQNPYWKYFKIYADYISRLSYMLSGGKHICDIAVLYPITSIWANMVNGKPTSVAETISSCYHDSIRNLLKKQLDLDVIDEYYLLRSDVEDGKIKVSNETYSVLILPPLTTIRRETISKIRSFYEAGGKIIGMKFLPQGSLEQGRNDPKVIQEIKDIFGLDPSKVEEADEDYILRINKRGGKAYFIQDEKVLPELVSECINRDIIITKGNPSEIYYLHRQKEGKDIYFVVNALEKDRTCEISFRSTGIPEMWDPETGQTYALNDLTLNENRTQLGLSFTPYQSYFIVFKKSRGKARLAKANTEGKFMTLKVDGKWNFIIAPKILDDKWECLVDSAQIDIPVMRFNWEREIRGENLGWHKKDFDDSSWDIIKICDVGEKESSCKRYLTNWRAQWITDRIRRSRDNPEELFFRKVVDVPGSVKEAWICATAVTDYEVFVNEKWLGEGNDWKKPKTYDIGDVLRKGKNVIAVRVKRRAKALSGMALGYRSPSPDSLISFLLEGEIGCSSGDRISLVSDRSWKVSREEGKGWLKLNYDDSSWRNAWVRGKPPLRPWGHLPLRDRGVEFPVNLWYRQKLPIGAKRITFPGVKGDCALYLNGEKLTDIDKGIDIPEEKRGEDNILAIRIKVDDFSGGLTKPVRIECEPTETELTSWGEKGLGWYSGRGVYTKEVQIPKEYLGRKIILDLGEVKHMVEVWVNNKLVSTRIWEPYIADITEYATGGKNKICLVVSNLLANEMRWKIFDEVKGRAANRYWHEDNIERDSQELVSGLLGPVKLKVQVK